MCAKKTAPINPCCNLGSGRVPVSGGGLGKQARVVALYGTLQFQQFCQHIWCVILDGLIVHMLLNAHITSLLHCSCQAEQGIAEQGRAGHSRAGQSGAGRGGTGQDRAGQGRAGQDRAGQGMAWQCRAGQGRTERGYRVTRITASHSVTQYALQHEA